MSSFAGEGNLSVRLFLYSVSQMSGQPGSPCHRERSIGAPLAGIMGKWGYRSVLPRSLIYLQNFGIAGFVCVAKKVFPGPPSKGTEIS